jgi:hypothetical protein
VDSGRNSAREMAPADVRLVEERNRRFNEVLSVNAVRRDWICRIQQVNSVLDSVWDGVTNAF